MSTMVSYEVIEVRRVIDKYDRGEIDAAEKNRRLAQLAPAR